MTWVTNASPTGNSGMYRNLEDSRGTIRTKLLTVNHKTPRLATFLILLMCGSFPCRAQTSSSVTSDQQTKRIVLKDGSYQMVLKYEVQGDRLHYLSAERYEWEDLPASLVDWDATKKYETALAAGKARAHVETPEEKEEREREAANSPEILPGLHLPGTGGVFLLDQFSGKPELAEILQNGSELSQKANKKSVLRTAINPIGSSKHAFELRGPHARIQAHTGNPVIYVDIDEGELNDVPLQGRFRLVKATIQKDVRIVGNLKVTFTGKTSQENNFLPVSVEKVGTGEWVKITPSQPIPPGEYAIVEMLGQDEMNLYVWDFGVNPQAPANPDTWRTAPAASDPSAN